MLADILKGPLSFKKDTVLEDLSFRCLKDNKSFDKNPT